MRMYPQSHRAVGSRAAGAWPAAEEAELADAHEAGWQQEKQEAADELLDSQSRESLLIAAGGVLPAEGNVGFREGN